MKDHDASRGTHEARVEDMSTTRTVSSEGQIRIELKIIPVTGDEYRSTIDAANTGNPGHQNMRSSSRSIRPAPFPAQRVPAQSKRPTLFGAWAPTG